MIHISIVIILSYLIGSIMPSIILTKKIKGYDVREKGSKNAGTTNVFRNAGILLGILTFIGDALKGVISVGISFIVAYFTKVNVGELAQYALIFAVLGHTFPIFFGFKGGKGVATALGGMLVIHPILTAILIVYAIVQLILTKMMSVASLSSAILLPVLMVFMSQNVVKTFEASFISYLVFSIILSTIIVVNHRSNIKRLRNGDEMGITVKENQKVDNANDNKEEENK